MSKYTVAITEIVEYLVPIEAKDEESASRLAVEKFNESADPFKDYGVCVATQEVEGVNAEKD